MTHADHRDRRAAEEEERLRGDDVESTKVSWKTLGPCVFDVTLHRHERIHDGRRQSANRHARSDHQLQVEGGYKHAACPTTPSGMVMRRRRPMVSVSASGRRARFGGRRGARRAAIAEGDGGDVIEPLPLNHHMPRR